MGNYIKLEVFAWKRLRYHRSFSMALLCLSRCLRLRQMGRWWPINALVFGVGGRSLFGVGSVGGVGGVSLVCPSSGCLARNDSPTDKRASTRNRAAKGERTHTRTDTERNEC